MKNLILLLSLVTSITLQGSHLITGNFSYEFVSATGGNRTYNIHLDLYRDNTGIGMPNNVTVYYRLSNSTNAISNFTAPQGSITNLSPSCGSALSSSVYRYSYNLTLPAGAAYDFAWGSCCKPSSINNIYAASNQDLYLTMRLVTSRYYRVGTNSVAIVPSINSVSAGIQMPFEICQADPDGDSLSFQQVPLFGGNSASLGRTNLLFDTAAGYSNINPLGADATFEIDTGNRMVIVESPTQKSALVNIQIIKWAKDTTNVYRFMGVTYREMLFNITAPPLVAPINITIDSISGIYGQDSLHLITSSPVFPYQDSYDSVKLVLTDPNGDSLNMVVGGTPVNGNYSHWNLQLSDTLSPGLWTIYARTNMSDTSSIYGKCGRKLLDSVVFYVSAPGLVIVGPNDSLYAPITTTYNIINHQYTDSIYFVLTNCSIISASTNNSAMDVLWGPINSLASVQVVGLYSDGSSSSDTLNASIFGIGMEELSNELKTYPNPANDWLELNGLNQGNFRYEIYDVRGSLRQHGKLSDSHRIDFKYLDSGCYILKLNTDKAKTLYQRFIIH